MIHFRTRHTLIVLSDRVLYAIRPPWRGRLSVRELPSSVSNGKHHKSPASLLQDALPSHKMPDTVDVVLGMAWTQMELVALPDKTISRKEIDSVAETISRRLQSQPPSQAFPILTRPAKLADHLLVASMAAPCRDGIVRELAQLRIRVASIQPLFSWLSIEPQTRFRQQDGWTALSEPGAVSIAHLTAGELDSLRTYRTDGTTIEFDQLLLRQAAASGLAADSVEVLSLADTAPTLPPGWASTTLLRSFPN